MHSCSWHSSHRAAVQMMINNSAPGNKHWRAEYDNWRQLPCTCFFPVIFCNRGAVMSASPFEEVMAMPQDSLIKGLPDNGVAPPAGRRACQPATRIEVNKLKCMCMHHGRLLSDQRGSRDRHLLVFLVRLNLTRWCDAKGALRADSLIWETPRHVLVHTGSKWVEDFPVFPTTITYIINSSFKCV